MKMLSLFRSELYQIRKTLAVKLLFLVITIVSVIMGIRETSAGYIKEIQEIGQDYILYLGGNLSGSMGDYAMAVLLAGLLAAWIISSGFENRTIQEAASYGRSRTRIYWVKMSVYIMASVLICLVYWFVTCIPLFIKNGTGTEDIVKNLCHPGYISGMLVSCILAYISVFAICGVIAFMVQKASITIGICIIGISLGFTLIRGVLPESLVKIINYTPAGLFERVLKLDLSWSDIIVTSCVSIAWIIITGVAGLYKFKTTELK